MATDIKGSSGDDTLVGTPADDILSGLEGHDLMQGGAGQDTLRSAAGDDTLDGGEGLDAVDFSLAATGVTIDLARHTATGEGNDTLVNIEQAIGSVFDDRLLSFGLNSVLDGGPGNDSLFAGKGNDSLTGGPGNDTLYGGTGRGLDGVQHGPNQDTAFYSGPYSDYTLLYHRVEVSLTLTDRVEGRDGVDVVREMESFSFAGTLKSWDELRNAAVAGPELLTGTEGNDTLDAQGGEDTVNGLGGHDSLAGGSGDDQLFGGEGNDTLVGGLGNDQLFGGEGNDTLYGGSEGADTLEGGAGLDRVSYTDPRAATLVVLSPTGVVTVGETPMDTLSGIERIHFAPGGGSLALDLALGQSAAHAVLVVGALMGLAPLRDPQFMATALAFFDSKATLLEACETLVSAGLVAAIAGSDSPRALVSLLFQQLTGSQPADLIDAITASVGPGPGQQTMAQLLAAAATLDITQNLVNLVGLAGTGLEIA